jgi:hypothetical protein
MADIFGVRVTAELNILDTLVIICNDPGGQTEPAVTFGGQYYFVAYLGSAFDLRTSTIKVSRVNRQGTVMGSGVTVGMGDYHPDIAFDGNRCLVVWSEEFHGVVGRYVNSSGQPEGIILDIALTQGTSTFPTIEFGTQHYLAVWPDFCLAGTDLDIFGQLVSTDGNLIGGRITIADGTAAQNYPAIVFDGSNYLVVWVEDANRVYGRFITGDGVPVGTKFPISDTTTYERQHPSVAAGTNNYLVAWNEYRDDFDVYGNVDVAIGIEENTYSLPLPTVFTSRIQRYINADSRATLYDIMGRKVTGNHITQGIYFLEIDNRITQRIVVVR